MADWYDGRSDEERQRAHERRGHDPILTDADPSDVAMSAEVWRIAGPLLRGRSVVLQLHHHKGRLYVLWRHLPNEWERRTVEVAWSEAGGDAHADAVEHAMVEGFISVRWGLDHDAVNAMASGRPPFFSELK
jgi:hypothetical protein